MRGAPAAPLQRRGGPVGGDQPDASGEHNRVVDHMLDAYLAVPRLDAEGARGAGQGRRPTGADGRHPVLHVCMLVFTWDEAIRADYHTNYTCKSWRASTAMLTVTESASLEALSTVLSRWKRLTLSYISVHP